MGLRRKLNVAVKPVKNTEEEKQILEKNRYHNGMHGRKLSATKVIEVTETTGDDFKPDVEYISLEVKGSNGKVYKIVMPKGYYKLVPKVWKWNEKRYKIAGAIAAGIPMTEISKVYDTPRSVIYGWLQHPEFKEHVDGLTLETGFANQRERIAGLNKITRLLFDKVVNEIGHVKLTDKSIGAVLSSIQMISKQLGQEKGEFVEQSKVDQTTNISGTVNVASVDVNNLLNEKTAEERKAMEAEFNRIGDDIIRSITGDKE